jgi:hypothetical protein
VHIFHRFDPCHRKYATGSITIARLRLEGEAVVIQKMMEAKAFSLETERSGPSRVLWNNIRRATSMPGQKSCEMPKEGQSSSLPHTIVQGHRFVKS